MIRPPLAPTLVLLAVLAAAPRAVAQQPPRWTIELSPRAAYLVGHTTYRIEGRDAVSSVTSELEFPIETGGIGVHARFARAREPGRGGPAFEVGGFFSIQERTGTMKDSDWIEGRAETDPPSLGGAGLAPHPGKDIYSETKAELEALGLEARAAWEFDALAPGVVLAPMIGVFYQRLQYDVHDGQQWGYGSWDTPAYTGAIVGPALDYRVRTIVPYVGGRAALAFGAFRARAELWASPIADVQDEDDHLLRQKLSKTDASGNAWSASVGAGYQLGARDSVSAEASIVRIRADGTQVQRFYGGPYEGDWGTIPSTITSSRTAFFVTYSHAL